MSIKYRRKINKMKYDGITGASQPSTLRKHEINVDFLSHRTNLITDRDIIHQQFLKHEHLW